MNETFTPGPWSLESDDNGYAEAFRRYAGADAIQVSGDHWTVAVALDDGPPGQANAHLIAAAPELYEALKAITDCYGVGQRDPAKFLEHVHDFMMEGRAALAKARGETNA